MRIILIILSITFFSSCQSQIDKKIAYLFFDNDNSEVFEASNRDRSERIQKKYKKNGSKNDITYKIFDEHFKSNPNRTREISQADFKKIKFSSISDIKEEWDKSGLFSSQKVFEELYIVESINGQYYQTKVTWIQVVY